MIMSARKYLIIVLLSLIAIPVFSQYYESGQDPASLKWKQIHTEHFHIIYPESFLNEGQRLANILEYAYTLVPYTLNHKPKKIPVIVHNYSSRSNGFVAWAPKRIELFPVPAADSYPQDELEQLVLHELRHVVQMDKLNQGFSKGLSIVFGEQAVGALSAMLPLWYLEGDAVATETALSLSGRGRLPSWEMELRALSLEKGSVFKYDKAIFGSYKDHTPGYYELGYQVVASGMEEYGPELWSETLDKIGKQPYTLNPMNLSLKKNSGMTKKGIYDYSFLSFHDLWKVQDKKTLWIPFDTINQTTKKFYTSYRLPQYLNDSTLLVEKSGIDQIRQLVKIDLDGNEELIHVPGFYYPIRFSYSKNLMVWAETYEDVRWENRSYSIIKKLNLTDGTEISLTTKSRYYAPALSPDASKIACIEVGLSSVTSLVILDSGTGEITGTYMLPGNNSLHMPEWMTDTSVLVILVNENGKSIQEIDLATAIWKEILEPSFFDIQRAIPWKNYILYHSTYSGIDNIYALDRRSGKKFQVTSSRFGIFDPCLAPSGNKIALSEYTAGGYNLVELQLKPDEWIPLNLVEDLSVKRYESLAEQQPGKLKTSETPDSIYEVKSYRKWSNPFSFHSWMPFYFDYDNFTLEDLPVNLGVTILSQNRLSTAVSSLGYTYRDGEHFFITRFTFKGWFPVIDMDYSLGGTPYMRKPGSISKPSEYSFRSVFNTQVYIPFRLTRNKFIKGFIPSLSLQYNNSYIYNEETGYYEVGELMMSSQLYFYNYLKLSRKDIKPQWGQVIDLYARGAPFNTETFGNSASFLFGLYLPGIGRHHSIYLQAGSEKQNPAKIQYPYFNRLTFPRGYQLRIAQKLSIVKIDYYLPLFYPEINLGSFLYIPRFYANAFYDYAGGEGNYDLEGHYNEEKETFSSLGGRIVMDFNFLRIPFPFNIGVRYSYMPELQKYDINFSFGVDFTGFQINHKNGSW